MSKQVDPISQLHNAYCNNIGSFVNKLPAVNIKFLFFFSNALDKPVVATLFSEYKDYYIVPGRDKNYWYAYKISNVKYLVSDYQVDARSGPIKLFSVNLSRKSHEANDINDAYLGNHIDFSIHKNRDHIFFKTHWTEYTDTSGSPIFFTRSSDQTCNFLLNQDVVNQSYTKFANQTMCVQGKQNTPIGKIEIIYTDEQDKRLIHDLCRVAITNQTMKKGGAPIPDIAGNKKYKGIEPTSSDLIHFVAKTLLRPLLQKVNRIDYCVYQYIDDGCVLNKNGCKSIQYVIEFDEDQVLIISVSTHRALKACWASLNTKESSEKEKKCLRQWLNCAKDIFKLFNQ